MNQTIQKIQKVRAHEKEVRRKYELQPQQKLMPFRTFLRKRLALSEALVRADVTDSQMPYLPNRANDLEKEEAVEEIAKSIMRLSQFGDVFLTAVAILPENYS